jgi:outer membrane protein assembly factor BamB
MRRFLVRPLTLCFTGALLVSGVAHAQGAPRGFWPVADGDAAHNRWQRAETQITTETVAKDFKFLWKLKLGNSESTSFSEPLLYPGMITGRGFKDFAFLGDANTLYAVDSELGTLVWQKDFPSSGAHNTCGNIQVLTEPPQIIHFGAHKPAAPRPAVPPPPPSDEPLTPAARRLGAAAGGGYFGLKGVYVLTSDGYLHEQIMPSGLDYAPPVKLFPAPSGSSFALNVNDKVVYTAAGSGCKNVADAIWSIDLKTPDYTVSSYKADKISVAGVTGPAIGADGRAFVVTGSGPDNPAAGVHANSVVALNAKDLKVKDWYTPSAGGKALNAGPVVFTYKDKELIAAPGKDGSIVLLDSQSLGGPDHHTPLAQTPAFIKDAKRGWDSLTSWNDKTGVWVLASISGPVNSEVKFANTNGSAPHGSVVAFKVEEQDGHTVLTPSWISRDLKNPAPPAIANGVIFALDGGSASAHATLYALDAATGKELYSSGDAIGSYTRLAGISVGDGHVFFTTHDNTLYSFGIPLEH